MKMERWWEGEGRKEKRRGGKGWYERRGRKRGGKDERKEKRRTR